MFNSVYEFLSKNNVIHVNKRQGAPTIFKHREINRVLLMHVLYAL